MSSHQHAILRPGGWSLSLSKFFWLTSRAPSSDPSFFPQYPAYDVSWLDLAFVAGWTLLFTVLREVMMRGVFAPFMRRWMRQEHEARLVKRASRANGKKLEASPLANGHSTTGTIANGHAANGVVQQVPARKGIVDNASAKDQPSKSKRMTKRQRLEEKKVTRFAEQGWSLLYYIVFWSFGAVSLVVYEYQLSRYFLRHVLSCCFRFALHRPPPADSLFSPHIVDSRQFAVVSFQTGQLMDRLSTHADTRSRQALLPQSIGILVPPDHSDKPRGEEEGLLPDDDAPYYYNHTHDNELRQRIHSGWVSRLGFIRPV